MFEDPNLPHAQQQLEDARRIGQPDYIASALYRFATIYKTMAETADRYNVKEWAQQYWLAAADYSHQIISFAHEAGNKKLEDASYMYEEHALWMADGGDSSAYYEQALANARQTGDHRRERVILLTLSDEFDTANDRDNALEYHRQAVAVSREIGDLELLIFDLGMLGGDYMGMEADDPASAIPCFEEALELSRSQEPQDRQSIAGFLSALGNAYLSAGDLPKSIQSYEEAIAMQRGNDELRSILKWNLNQLAPLYLHQDAQKAQSLYDEALALSQSSEDKREKLNQLSNMSLTLSHTHPEQAMNYAEQALTLAHQTGDHDNVSQSLKIIGELHFRAAHYEQAIKIFMDLLDLERQNNETLAESQTLMRLSGMHKQMGDTSEATTYMKQGMLLRANDPRYPDPFNQFSLAKILEDEGDLAAALAYAQRASDYFAKQEVNDPNMQYWVQQVQDRIASIRQKLDAAD